MQLLDFFWKESNAKKALEAVKKMQCQRKHVTRDFVELRVGDKVLSKT